MNSPDHRYEVLDGLRGIAAISVMLIHLPTGAHALMPHAAISVDLFFILSGFVLTRSYREKLLGGMSAWAYFKRRLIRIYPMFFIGMLIGIASMIVAMESGNSGYPLRSYVSSVVSNILFIPYFGHYGTPNMTGALSGAHLGQTVGELFPSNLPAWSLFFEMVGSMGFLYLITLKKSALRTIILASAILLTLMGILASYEQGRSEMSFNEGWSTARFFGGYFRVAFGFACGIYIATSRDDVPLPRWMQAFNAVVRTDLVLYILFIGLISLPWGIKGLIPALLTFVASPILVLRGKALHTTGFFSRNAARFLGWISYPVYCLHYPIGRLIFLTLPSCRLHPAMGTALTALVTLAVAVVVTRFIEEPIRAYLSNRLFRETTQPGGVAGNLVAGHLDRAK
jgi:peptidoglycan/LPS O-acetylase OafA/YrhL